MNIHDQAEPGVTHEFELSPEIAVIMELATQAGAVLKKYHKTNLDVDYKKDQFDPVSIADRESDELLRAGIARAFTGDEILSEENPLLPESYSGNVWMVDPLDDTKGYLAGRDTAGVMVGLLEAGKPKMGVVYLPFRNEWYFAEAGKGAFRRRSEKTTQLHVSSTTSIEDAVLVGRNIVQGDTRPIDKAVEGLNFASVIPEGCIGAKIGLVAAGEADSFIHTNLKAGKWDTLAAEVILREAGGVMSDIDGNELDYSKADSGWDRYFVASATKTLQDTVISKLTQINEDLHVF